MIKFGNDIVTVGGDWLKYEEPEPPVEPTKLAEYLQQQITIYPNGYSNIFTNVSVTESNYAVVKVNYSQIQGALVIGLTAGSSDVTVDVATGSRQTINFTYADLTNFVAYDGTVSGNVITLSNTHFITRVIFDFNARKVHFYDINNALIASADFYSGMHYTPVSIKLLDPSTSNQTRCYVSGEIWQCGTMEQALSV